MSIPYISSGFNPSPPSPPAFQDWESPTPSELVYIQTGNIAPLPVTIPIKIKDVIGTPLAQNYTQFRVRVSRINFGGNTTVNWLAIGSTLVPQPISGTVQTKTFSTNGQIDNITLTLQNAHLLNEGSFSIGVWYAIEGNNSSGWSLIESYYHFINLSVFETQPITWSPASFDLFHVQNSPRPQQLITMTGDDWGLITGLNFILESDDPLVTITTSTTSLGTQYFAKGSGNRVVKLKLGDYYDTAPALTPGTYNLSLLVSSGISTLVGSIPYKLTILAQSTLYASPTELNFESVKGGVQPTPQDVSVFAPSPFTFTHPIWLSVTPTAESAPGVFSNLRVAPINSSSLSAGEYNGEIELTLVPVGGGATQTQTIDVNYILHDFVRLPYSTEEFNFTKDPLFLEFYTSNDETYFDVMMTLQIFDWFFQGGAAKTVQIPFKVPLYNKFQKENIGERIERAMAKYFEPNLIEPKQYQAATVALEITEKKYPSHEQIRSVSISGIKFLSGITPKIKSGNNAILELSNNSKRVTPNSFDYLNLMLGDGFDKILGVYINGVPPEGYIYIPTYNTYKHIVHFSDFNVQPGDQVEVRIYPGNIGSRFFSKKYIVIPEQEYSNMILWEDDYKMLQSYEFTGKHTVKSDFSFQNFNKKKNLIEYLQNIETKDVEKITINTGFVPKNDIVYIKNIIRARRIWLYVSETELVELTSETKSLVFDDVDRELNYFDLDFTINKKYNEESHSF